jgi:hypothetical protein
VRQFLVQVLVGLVVLLEAVRASLVVSMAVVVVV